MSIYSELRQALRKGTLVVLSSYFPTTISQDKGIIFSHTNGTEPSIPYVVIQIGKASQEGRTSYSTYANSVENLTIVNHYRVTVQFSFLGTTSGDMAYDFDNAIINNVVVREAFQRLNLAPVEKTDVRRIPVLRETKWTEFESLNVVFTYAVKTTQAVDIIEHIRIVYADDQNPDTEETLYIPPLTT